jgi:hypothetical protein
MQSAGCAQMMYWIDNIDKHTAKGFVKKSYANDCVPEILISWDEGVASGWVASSRFSGEKVAYVQVNLKKVISDLVRYVNATSSGKCGDNKKIEITLNSIEHKHDLSTDTGIDYIFAGVEMSGKIKCGNNDGTFSKTLSSRSRKIKLGFNYDQLSVQKAISEASTHSIMNIIEAVVVSCRKME